MWNNILYYLLRLLSKSPILNVADDSNFGTMKKKKKKEYYLKLRISLFVISLGIIKIYILTYHQEEGFNFFNVKKLSDILYFMNLRKHKEKIEKEVEGKADEFEKLIEEEDSENINKKIEILKYKLEEENKRKDKSYNKVNTYIVILLGLFTISIPTLLNFSNWGSSLYYIFAFVIFYNLMNVTILLYNILKVNSFSRFILKEVKEIKEKKKLLIKMARSFYKDWYCKKEEARIFVTYVLNIETYIKQALFFAFLLIICHNLFVFYTGTINENKGYINNRVLIDLSKNDQRKFNSSLIRINNLQKIYLKMR